MNIREKQRKAKAGVLLIASPRFRQLGKGLSRGTYQERQEKVVSLFLDRLCEQMEVTFPGVVYEREDAMRAIQQFFVEKVDFVIVRFLSWSEDFAWIRFLRDMPILPMIFVNVAQEKMTFTTTTDEDDFIDYLCAGTLVGSLEAAGSIARIGRPYMRIMEGSLDECLLAIQQFAEAAKVRSILRNSTVGLLANYNEAMWSTYMDPYNLFTKIGPELRFIAYSTLHDEITRLPESEVRAWQNQLSQTYRVDADVADASYYASVRASLALAKLAQAGDIDVMVYNDIDVAMFELIGLRAGFYHPSFNQSLSVLVPEADMGAGLITYILKLLSGKRVNFIEPFHIEAAYGTFAGGHAGPNDYNEVDPSQVIIARDVRFAKTHYKYAGAPFAWLRIPPGRKTMAQLVEETGRYKLICTMVESLPGEHLLATYSHSIFKPDVPVKRLFEEILNIGSTQHFGLVDGDYREVLRQLCQLMNFEYYEIK